jgi:hypothetical protein
MPNSLRSFLAPKICFTTSWTLTIEELNALLVSANVDASDHDKVLSFLLYYGVLGVQIGEAEYFIFDVNYDLKVLRVRADRGKADTRYVVNPAFWPAFSIVA